MMPRLNTYELVTLGRVLRDTRRARGLSMRGAAEAAGLSKDTLWGWEAGRHKPQQFSFEAICAVYEVSAAELLRELYRRAEHRPYPGDA